jgi:hypothetical protein
MGAFLLSIVAADAFDGSRDVVGGFGPSEGLWVGVQDKPLPQRAALSTPQLSWAATCRKYLP